MDHSSELSSLKAPERVSDTVYHALREEILSQRLPPGYQLSVPDLARRLGVSRSPVREAVLQLVAEGLATEEPRKGASVARFDSKDVREVHEVREVLEGLAARLCASVADNSALTGALSEILERQEAAVSGGDGGGYLKTELEFHSAIAAGSGNDRLGRFLGTLHGQMRLALLVAAGSREYTTLRHREHQDILTAIESRDPSRAESLMREHIASSRAWLSSASA